MNARRLIELARLLDVQRPEVRVRYNDFPRAQGEYSFTVAVIQEGQVSGPPVAQQSANRDEFAYECVRKELEDRVREKLREAERVVAECRKLLDENPADSGE